MRLFKTVVMCSAVFSFLISASACKEKKADQKEGGEAPVSAVKVVKTDLPFEMQYPAQVDGSVNLQVRAQVGGILKGGLYEEGAYVTEGAPLFQIDDSTYKVALQKAEGTLAQVTADRKRTEKDFNRMKTLRKSNSISKKDYDDALAAFESAKANEQVAQAEVDNAKINLGYTTVVAPVSGITSIGAQSPGVLVNPAGDTGLLTTIIQIDPLFINFSMPSNDFIKLAQGFVQGSIKTDDTNQKPIMVQVILPDGTIYPDLAKIIFLDNTEDPKTSSIFLRASMANPNNQRLLMPGQFVRVNLLGVNYKDQLVIPDSAVLNTPSGDIAYVIKEDGTIETRTVTGQSRNSIYMIGSGLKEGETVVFDGLIKVRAGQKVKPQMHEFKINEEDGDVSHETVPVNIPGIASAPKGGATEVTIKDTSAATLPFVSAVAQEGDPDAQSADSVAVSTPAANAAQTNSNVSVSTPAANAAAK